MSSPFLWWGARALHAVIYLVLVFVCCVEWLFGLPYPFLSECNFQIEKWAERQTDREYPYGW